MKLRATRAVNSSEVGLRSATVIKPLMGRQRKKEIREKEDQGRRMGEAAKRGDTLFVP